MVTELEIWVQLKPLCWTTLFQQKSQINLITIHRVPALCMIKNYGKRTGSHFDKKAEKVIFDTGYKDMVWLWEFFSTH